MHLVGLLFNTEFHFVEFKSGGQHNKHTVQHGTLKSSEITVSRAPIYLKDHGVEGFCTSPLVLLIIVVLALREVWSIGGKMAFGSPIHRNRGLEYTGRALMYALIFLVCVPLCVVHLKWAAPLTKGHTTSLIDAMFRN